MTRDLCAKKNLLKTQIVRPRLGKLADGRHTLLTFLIVFALVLYVGMRVEIWLLGYSISDTKQEFKALTEANQELVVKLATLKDPDHVIEVAQRDFGLQDPGERIIYLE